MEMVFHEAVGEQAKLMMGDRFGQEMEKGFPIPIFPEDRALFDPSVKDVVEGAFEKDPGRPWHR
jgi:hypothetical protein